MQLKKIKKILFLSPLPPPTYGSALSSQTCLDVLRSSNKYSVENIRINYSENFDDVGKFSFKKALGFMFVLIKIIKRSIIFRPNLVYLMPATSGFAFFRDFIYAITLKLFRQNIIFHLRTQITEKDKNNKFKNYIFRKSFKNCNVIVLGKELESDILSYFSKEKVFILPNAISKTLSDEEFEAILKRKDKSNKLHLVFLSNMMKVKGWPKALEAAKILRDRKIDFIFNFAGSWPSALEESEFNRFVMNNNLAEQIKYIGFVDKTQKFNLLANSDILVFPTEYEYEALPRVIIEAMEFGIPQISTVNGSIPSLIEHQETGFLLEENSAENIAKYIIALTNKKVLIAMGRKVRNRFLSNYELAVFQKKFLGIIEKAIPDLSEY